MEKIVLLFPGQGSQYVGMMKHLYEQFPLVKQVFAEANDILGYDLQAICFNGSQEELTQTRNAQCALLTAGVAAFRVYMQEIGIKPCFSLGHSLGEYTALCCAGVFPFPDALKIVNERGRVMQEVSQPGTCGMTAIEGVEKDIVQAQCQSVSTQNNIVAIANINSPTQTVISGHKSPVDTVSTALAGLAHRIVPLKVSGPFHSPLMAPAAAQLEKVLSLYSFHPFQWPVISNVTARPYLDAHLIVENLTRQLVTPVRWQESMEFVWNQRVTSAVELGPRAVLKKLTIKNSPLIAALTYDNEEDILQLKKKLVLRTDREALLELMGRCLAIAVCTRNRNWNEEQYKKGVEIPYRDIRQLKEEIEAKGKTPTIEQMKASLEMLRSVFITKQVPPEEQVERFNQVFSETGTRHLFPDFKMPGPGIAPQVGVPS